MFMSRLMVGGICRMEASGLPCLSTHLSSAAMPSLFSKIIAGQIPAQFVFKDDTFVCFLDIAPANPGHVLLVPRHESQYLSSLPSDVLARLGPMLAKLITVVKQATGCPAVNVLVNDGPEANQGVPHCHLHVIPRYAGDGKLSHPHGTPYQGEEMQQMATKLKNLWQH
jgi:histidine triad (HIT) family protein